MNEHDKKLFAQCDDDFAGVRQQAFEQLRESLKRAGQSFRDMLLELEKSEKFAELETNYKTLEASYAKAKQDNDGWVHYKQRAERELAELRRKLALYKSLTWLRMNRRWLFLLPALPVAAITGWIKAMPPWPATADSGLRRMAASATWGEGFDKPFVTTIAGAPYWILLRGQIDASSYAGKDGRTVEMRCLHIYAVTAEADSGEYIRRSPYFLGWLKWPERVVQCQPSPIQQASK